MSSLMLIKNLGRKFTSEKKMYKKTYCIYKCFCNKEFIAQKNNVDNGNTKSCGCLQKKRTSEARKTHGDCKTRLYKIYIHMKTRCYNKKEKQYKDWGGRGIVICQEWLNSYTSFRNWALENGYKKNLSIDRKDNDGNYEPSNCRWAKRTTQARNTRLIYSSNKSGYRGVSWNKRDEKWNSIIGVDNENIYIGKFECKIDAAYAYDTYVKSHGLEHTKNFS